MSNENNDQQAMSADLFEDGIVFDNIGAVKNAILTYGSMWDKGQLKGRHGRLDHGRPNVDPLMSAFAAIPQPSGLEFAQGVISHIDKKISKHSFTWDENGIGPFAQSVLSIDKLSQGRYFLSIVPLNTQEDVPSSECGLDNHLS